MEHKCKHCGKEFGSEEAVDVHTRAEHPEPEKKPVISSKLKKKIKFWTITAVVILLIAYGFYAFANIKTLPPIDMQGHVEASPASHILKEPMKLAVQKHMLEHVDGRSGGRGGVIINYDCKNYGCASDLVSKLEAFANEFDFVYVAPYKNMRSKIVLTRLGKIKQLDEYDEEAIRFFVGG